MRVERQEDRARMLLVQRSDDRLYDRDRGQGGEEELEEAVVRERDGGEERGLDVPGEDERGADGGGAVGVIEFVAQGFVQGDDGCFGGAVVRCNQACQYVLVGRDCERTHPSHTDNPSN